MMLKINKNPILKTTFFIDKLLKIYLKITAAAKNLYLNINSKKNTADLAKWNDLFQLFLNRHLIFGTIL
jgi:hypothetical protein